MYRKQIILGIFIFMVLISLILVIIFSLSSNKSTNKKEKEIVLTKKKDVKKEDNFKEEYKVDIKGEVNNPGIYTLDKSSRVVDVIEKAGGLSENANTTVINLSKKIMDEMVIIIYSNYEVENFKRTKELEKSLINSCINGYESLKNDACIDDSDTEGDDDNDNDNSKVSLNNSSKEELMTLTGIGEKKALDIIEYREKNNGFKNIEDIKNIKGIGDSIFDKIKDRLTL